MLFESGTVNDVYPRLVSKCLEHGAQVGSRVASTRELHPAVIEFTNPRHRLVTSWGRPVNVPFALAEVLWILQGREDLEMLAHYNSRIHDYSDDGHFFNAAYGYRLRYNYSVDQLADIIETLQNEPESRQAVMTIWSPIQDRGWYNPGTSTREKRITKDRACNVTSQALARDGVMDWTQYIRSNDLIWGLPYNLMQWTHIMEYVAEQADLKMGKLYWIANSLHVYDYHWQEAQAIRPYNLYADLWPAKHEPMGKVTPQVLSEIAFFEMDFRCCHSEALFSRVEKMTSSGLNDYWKGVLLVLAAWRAYKEKQDTSAFDLLVECFTKFDKVYAAATIRFMYANRWKNGRRFHQEILDQFSETTSLWGVNG